MNYERKKMPKPNPRFILHPFLIPSATAATAGHSTAEASKASSSSTAEATTQASDHHSANERAASAAIAVSSEKGDENENPEGD
jgi:hypothetical protein